MINWKKTGLIEFKDKNGDGIIQYLGDLSKNEVKIDKDIIVLANPEIAKLPNWVIALVAAGEISCSTFHCSRSFTCYINISCP